MHEKIGQFKSDSIFYNFEEKLVTW